MGEHAGHVDIGGNRGERAAHATSMRSSLTTELRCPVPVCRASPLSLTKGVTTSLPYGPSLFGHHLAPFAYAEAGIRRKQGNTHNYRRGARKPLSFSQGMTGLPRDDSRTRVLLYQAGEARRHHALGSCTPRTTHPPDGCSLRGEHLAAVVTAAVPRSALWRSSAGGRAA